MIEAEAGAAGGVDLDNAGDAQRIRLAQACFGCTGMTGAGAGAWAIAAGLAATVAVVSTSSLAASFAGAGNGSAARAAIVLGAP